jgi:hypothetical protein
LSLGSYILGVGDRHLDNFLFDFVQGKIIPIDFGYSFGFGIGLYIPEMMPFRMTQNFVELTYPLGLEGIYRNSMIFALKALKDHKHLLVDTCEVFIRDPLLDWIKMARGKVTNGTSQMIEMETNIYPRDKLKVVQMKLNGYNPVTGHALRNGKHKAQGPDLHRPTLPDSERREPPAACRSGRRHPASLRSSRRPPRHEHRSRYPRQSLEWLGSICLKALINPCV